MPAISHIKETCLYVSDLSLCRDFYHRIMELPVISYKEGRHVFFRAGSDVLLCFLPEVTRMETVLAPHFASGRQHFAFECPAKELASWKNHLALHNVQIERQVDWGKGRQSIYFRDPDGHSVEIVTPGLWDPE